MDFPISNKKLCTGCEACVSSCPVDAMKMEPDSEGFLYPSIDQDKCINCGLCGKICPVNNPATHTEHDLEVYAAWHTNPAIREKSSSGGAFTALAQAVLRRNGVVFGAAYAPFPYVRHIAIENENDLDLLRGSKYVQSRIGDSFIEVKKRLDNKQFVLFVGTPCQILGLKKFIGKDHPYLISCDLICHGVPSPVFFEQYLKFLCKNNYDNSRDFNFRSKRSGWYDALRECELKNGKIIIAKNKKDFYFKSFNLNLTLRESCYQCPGLGTSRLSDITIGDFWGIGKVDAFKCRNEIPLGISLVIVQSQTGKKLFQESSSFLNVMRRTIDEAVHGNRPLIQSSKRPIGRNTFYADYDSMEFSTFYRCYLSGSFRNRMIAFSREYFPKNIVLFLRKYITKNI